ncbi:O-antigen ligase family protein [Microbacterium amylolyticum]|uniref:O-antigen ligase family protein n=1 Tax=Microbacterium amylolyticum TaxID=936337 RepID=UPI00361B4672
MTAALQRIAYQHRRLRTVFAGPLGALLPLLVLLPALTGYGAIQSLFGIDNGAMLQKIFVFICVAVAGILVGFRIPPWPVLVLFGVFATAFFIASLLDLRDAGPGDLVLIRGTAGYVYAWCVFFVDWRQVNVRSRAVSLAFAPIIAVLISVPLSISGHTIFIMHEYTGALRLAAGMPPAYLASLALFGVIGAAWLWSLGSPWGLWVSVANAGICALTGTRGATLAAGLVFVAMLIVAVLYRLRQWRVGIGVGVVGLVAGAMLFIPLFMQRSTASAHGILGFSGRTEAWSYFMRRFQEHPWTGFGPGVRLSSLKSREMQRLCDRLFRLIAHM